MDKGELENGYYWVSFEGDTPVIIHKSNYGWYVTGLEYEMKPRDFKVLGKVSNTIEEIK